MCTVCGCGTEAIEGQAPHGHKPHHHDHGHPHNHEHDHDHAHDHDHDHDHHHDHEHGHHHHEHAHDHHHGHDHAHHHDHPRQTEGLVDAGAGLAGVHVPGLSQERIVRIERDILSKNNAYAQENRARLARTGTFALNLVSSPGSGKTTLLCRTIEALKPRLPIAVIEGDQQTSNDAECIRATGVKAVQVTPAKAATSTPTWSATPWMTCLWNKAACCSSRMWAICSAPRHSAWARLTRTWCCRSPKARTSRRNTRTCSPPR